MEEHVKEAKERYVPPREEARPCHCSPSTEGDIGVLRSWQPRVPPRGAAALWLRAHAVGGLHPKGPAAPVHVIKSPCGLYTKNTELMAQATHIIEDNRAARRLNRWCQPNNGLIHCQGGSLTGKKHKSRKP